MSTAYEYTFSTKVSDVDPPYNNLKYTFYVQGCNKEDAVTELIKLISKEYKYMHPKWINLISLLDMIYGINKSKLKINKDSRYNDYNHGSYYCYFDEIK